MGRVLLSEKMNTRFIINALTGRLREVLDSIASTGDELDLAGCKFGPFSASLLQQYYDCVNFCNSGDTGLDAILKNNCERSRTELEEYEPLILTGTSDINTYLEKADTLVKGGKYAPIIRLDSPIDKATLVLLIMTRPDVEFDIRSCASDIFDFVRSVWLSSWQHHNAYYELVAPDIVVRRVDSSGYYGGADYSRQKETSFVRNRIVLPIEFGNEYIGHPTDGSEISDEWAPVIDKCIDVFTSMQRKEEKKQGKVLRNMLQFREESNHNDTRGEQQA